VAKTGKPDPWPAVKDRIGVSMMADAEKGRTDSSRQDRSDRRPAGTPESLSLCSRGQRLKLILTHARDHEPGAARAPAGIAVRRSFLRPVRAECKGAVLKAEELLASTPDGYILQQSTNPANPKIHFETTVPKSGKTRRPRRFSISGVGTGGTITGVSNTSRRRSPLSRRLPSSRRTAQCFPAASRRRTRFRASEPGLFPASCGAISSMRSSPSATKTPLTWRGVFLSKKVAGWHLLRSGGGRALQVARARKMPEIDRCVLPSFGERYLSSILFEGLRNQALQIPTSQVPA